jgi:hypothetical protein
MCNFCLPFYFSFIFVITLQYHLFSALAEYQPYVYSTLLFLPAVQTYGSEAEEDLEYFDMVF